MSAMTRHIGTEIDFPSMGANVGGPEIGYLYGQVGTVPGGTFFFFYSGLEGGIGR